MALTKIQNFLVDIGYSINHPDVDYPTLVSISEYLKQRGDIYEVDEVTKYIINNL